MDMTIRAMKPDERNYSYTQEKSVQKKLQNRKMK